MPVVIGTATVRFTDMAFIVEEFIGDRGIQLGVEELTRPMSFGTDWQKLRLGVHWAFNGSVTLAAGIQPRVGFCIGNNGWNNNPTDAIGATAWNSFTPTLSGVAPNLYYNSATTVLTTQQNIGGTVTNVANNYAFLNPSASAAPTINRSAWFFTLTKGTSGSASINHQYSGTLGSQAAADISRSSFLAQMESESVAISGITLNANSATTLQSGVYTKLWDSIFINWNRAVPTVCIYEICVTRFA